MGSCCSVKSAEEVQSSEMFKAVDLNNDKKASQDEIAAFVASRPELWAMLSVNLGISEDKCRETATRVAMEVASSKQGKEALDTELSKQQFHDFRSKYMLNGQGAQEFFHRCVFASFDHDNNNLLDTHELDAFLETFYKAGSIFEGDARLPEKAVLKQTIIDKYSTRADDMLSFDELRDIIRGTGAGPPPPKVQQAKEQPAQTEPPKSNMGKKNNSNNNKKESDAATARAPLAPKKKSDSNANANANTNNGNAAPRKRRQPKTHMDVPGPNTSKKEKASNTSDRTKPAPSANRNPKKKRPANNGSTNGKAKDQ